MIEKASKRINTSLVDCDEMAFKDARSHKMFLAKRQFFWLLLFALPHRMMPEQKPLYNLSLLDFCSADWPKQFFVSASFDFF